MVNRAHSVTKLAQGSAVRAGLALLLASTSCRQIVDFEQQTPSEGPALPAYPGLQIGNGYEKRFQFDMNGATRLSTADYDGDGRLEVLSSEEPVMGLAKFAVHYFDAAGEQAASRAFPWPTTLPVARDVDRDGRSDLTLSDGTVVLLPGRVDRAWFPAPLTTFVFPDQQLRVVGVQRPGMQSGGKAVFLGTLDGVSAAYVALDVDGAPLSQIAELEAPVAELTCDPVAADVVEGKASPCRELMLAFLGASSFRVLDLCQIAENSFPESVAWRPSPLEQVVQLPDGVTLSAGLLVADVDGDDHLDVIVGANGHPYVTHGDGERLEPVASPLALELPEYGLDSSIVPMPLVAADINDDKLADFVVADLLAVSRPRPEGGFDYTVPSAIRDHDSAWTRAQVVDLNGNGLPDLVMASAESGLTFINGQPGDQQILKDLATKDPVTFMATGDFDGDFLEDLAVVEQRDDATSPQSLSVSFGSRELLPSNPHSVAQLAGTTQLTSLTSPRLDTIVAISDGTFRGEAGSAVTLFHSTPERLVVAAGLLSDVPGQGSLDPDQALELSVGQFRGQAASDAIILGADSWWLLADLGDRTQPPRPLQGERLPYFPDVDSPDEGPEDAPQWAASAAADLDRDGQDESIWLASPGMHACLLATYTLDVAAVTLLPKGSSVVFDEPCLTPQLSVQDFDGDGSPDIMALIGHPGTGPRQLRILWNDGTGGFSRYDRTLVPIGNNDVRGFSAFAAGSRQIALVTDEGLYVVAATAQSPRSLGTLTRIEADFNEPSSVVVTDANGDGFADLVVADAEGLSLVKARRR